MDEFPKTQGEFQRRFRREDACRRYLLQCRWPGGFQCPSCGSRHHWVNQRLILVCSGCRRFNSLTAGTLLHKTRKPLSLWFQTMWWVVTQKTGGSAKGLQRLMGLGSYQTAWTWLHKLRRAMVRAGREKLSGWVEVDEAWVGGSEKGASGRQTRTKSEIVLAVEFEASRIGRVRIQVVPDSSARHLVAFVTGNVDVGSHVVTDGWQGYATLEKLGYRHKAHTIGYPISRASKLLPRVHRVIALIKRWLLGTHQGRCTRKYMQHYMDEFVFRFNRRKSRHVGNLFRRMLQQVGQSTPLTYRQLAHAPRASTPQ